MGVIGAVIVALKGSWYDVVFPLVMVIAVYGAVPRAAARPVLNGVIAGAASGLLTVGVDLGVHGAEWIAADPAHPARAILTRLALVDLPLMVLVCGFGTWLMLRARRFAEEQRRRRKAAREAARRANRRKKKKK